ncbi:MAG: signal recognition particle-docking protein FtsY [Nitrospiraceae bacterium]|nr:signal recognition particle-docking protein FtsY [Nitrospiraceae bacterium]
MGFLDKLKGGLQKTRQALVGRVDAIFSGGKALDEESLEELEEALIGADIGVKTAGEITGFLKGREAEIRKAGSPRQFLKTEMSALLGRPEPLVLFGERPFVILTVGVNGTGKTTTIGKLASRFVSEGHRVVLAAADTFRAAAIEQLDIWAERSGAQIIKQQAGGDPAAVAFDAVEAAKKRGADIVIVDTAGRLHTKSPLMEELKKVKRVIQKAMPEAPQETLLVVDATTGQNALSQAKLFNEAIGVTGIVLTKLDGTAKGGIVFTIKRELGIPIKLIGVGEGVDDLRDFNPQDFMEALFSTDQE